VSANEQLSRFVFKLQDQGVQYTNWIVMQDVTRIVPSFQAKSTAAKEQIVHGFTKNTRLTHRIATHIMQKHFSETKNELSVFINDEGQDHHQKKG
jgi:hypothetical protein